MPPTRLHRLKSQAGAALVLVLSTLVLLSIVALAYLGSTSVERASSQSYSDGAKTRMLADTALEIVKGQIWAATTEANAIWASQPGAIRTWTGDGSSRKVYKLYSAREMVSPISGGNYDSGSFTTPPVDDIPGLPSTLSSWLFTDLNEPVISQNRLHFPIVDPRASTANPGNYGGAAVPGFSISPNYLVSGTGSSLDWRLPMPVRWMYILENGSLVVPDASGRVAGAEINSNPIVGRIAFWTDDDTTKLNINTAAGGEYWDIPLLASESENIGSTEPNQRFTFQKSQPARNEFQRYPGHPATVHMSNVFNGIGGNALTSAALKHSFAQALSPRILSDQSTEGAKGSQGGTKRVNTTTFSGVNVWNQPTSYEMAMPLTKKEERLYASTDELNFTQARDAVTSPNTSIYPTITADHLSRVNFFLTAYNRAPDLNLLGYPRVSLWPLHPTNRTAYDQYIATCATIGTGANQKTFSFLRQDNRSTTADVSLSGNTELLNYLRGQMGRTIPGFGASFEDKFQSDTDQLLVLMADFIRSVNSTDTVTGALPFTIDQSTMNAIRNRGAHESTKAPPGIGQFAPLEFNGKRGLGRVATISQVGLMFFSTAWPIRTWTANTTAQIYRRWVDGNNTPVPYLRTPLKTGTSSSDSDTDINNEINGVFSSNGTLITPGLVQLNPTLTGPFRPLYRALFLIEPFVPLIGYGQYSPEMEFEVRGLNTIQVNGQPIGFPSSGTVHLLGTPAAGSPGGGALGIHSLFSMGGGNFYDSGSTNPGEGASYKWADPVSRALIQQTGQTIGDPYNSRDINNQRRIFLKVPASSSAEMAQKLHYPLISVEFPLDTAADAGTFSLTSGNIEVDCIIRDSLGNRRVLQTFNFNFTPANPLILPKPGAPQITYDSGDYSGRSILLEGSLTRVPWGAYATKFMLSGDTVVSMVPTETYADFRSTALLETVPVGSFIIHPGAGPSIRKAHSFVMALNRDNGSGWLSGDWRNGFNGINATTSFGTYVNLSGNNAHWVKRTRPGVGPHISRVTFGGNGSLDGDWTHGYGSLRDGPYVFKPDEGSVRPTSFPNPWGYFENTDPEAYGSHAGIMAFDGYTAPNRQITSAFAFGSLPAGNTPWRTLLFTKNPSAGSSHPGFANPPDYLLADLFNMPMVEPYAISEPFSTAGRLNMNYRLIPFSYIRRDTSVRAALATTKLLAVPDTEPTGGPTGGLQVALSKIRMDIDPTETLKQFDALFDSGEICKSATQIANFDLYNVAQTSNMTTPNTSLLNVAATSWDANRLNITNFWSNRRNTADNLRERPYERLYPLLTTQSNTYTVHVKVQSIKQPPGPNYDIVDGREKVTSEWRGSFSLERFLDPKNSALPNFMNANSSSAMGFYQFRVNNTKQFLP